MAMLGTGCSRGCVAIRPTHLRACSDREFFLFALFSLFQFDFTHAAHQWVSYNTGVSKISTND